MESRRARQQSNTPRVRTRQGCWSCRRRRRKCDEDKPSCQNCIRKGLKCQYGIQLTFHDSNLLELDVEEAKQLRERAPDKYERVQFVGGMGDDLEDCEQNYSTQEEMQFIMSDNTDPLVETSHLTTHMLHSELAAQESFGLSNDQGNIAMGDISEIYDTAETPMRDSSSRSETFNATTTGLSQRGDIDTRQGSFRQVIGLDSEVDPGPSASFAPDSSVSSGRIRPLPQIRNSETATPNSNRQMLDSRTNQDLLKYYIDYVAPWLEINSMEALYSTHIPLISSKYEPLRQSIFALVAAQIRGLGTTPKDTFLETSLRTLGPNMYSRHEEPILARQLLLISQILSLDMKKWRSALKDEVLYFNELGIHGLSGDVQGSSSWLILRFDIAVAINSRQPLVTNIKNWQQENPPSPQSNSLPTNSTHLEKALLLCANIVELWQSVDSKIDIDCWTQHSATLQTLKKEPTSDISMPIFKSAIGKTTFTKPGPISLNYAVPTSFPISIYTNRPYFYVQFLSHLAHILLIECKPRQVPSQSAKSLDIAPWHAVQLCGLALSNPILWSWDPIVVASLLLAGPFLSYSEQQTELLRYLKQLRKTTGWIFDHEIQYLEDFWKTGY